MVAHLTEGRHGRPPPWPRALLRTRAGAAREPDRVAHQGVQHAREGAEPVNLRKEQLDHGPGVGVRSHVDVARGEEHIPHRDPVAQGSALGLVETAALQTRAPRMAFDCTPRPWSAEEEAIMRSAGLVHAILIRKEGAKQRAHCAHMLPVFGAARQPTHLQPQDEADMVHSHLSEAPLEPVSALGRGAALALLLVADQPTGGRPAQGNSLVV